MSEGAEPSPTGLGKSWEDLGSEGRPGSMGSYALCLLGRGTPAPAPLHTVQTEELHSIRGELSQIKAQVDRLLETLERMDQQRDQLLGQAPPTGGPACTPSELQLCPLLKVPGGMAPGILLSICRAPSCPPQGLVVPMAEDPMASRLF